jgi:hypothetical protein
MSCKQQSDILSVFSQFIRPSSLFSYTSKSDCIFLNIYWASFGAMTSKALNAMTAHLKFLILLAIFLSASYAHAFTSLSPVAGNQGRVNQLT